MQLISQDLKSQTSIDQLAIGGDATTDLGLTLKFKVPFQRVAQHQCVVTRTRQVKDVIFVDQPGGVGQSSPFAPRKVSRSDRRR